VAEYVRGDREDPTLESGVSPTTETQLRDLAVRYAAAADGRDADRFTEVFFPDATLTVQRGADTQRISGREELRVIPERLRRYDRTFHLLGQSTYEVHRAEASGEVYCIANHLKAGVNTVMYIRYEDDYHQNSNGQWLIKSRLVVVEWIEDHQVSGSASPDR
jgi:hypothetical protein